MDVVLPRRSARWHKAGLWLVALLLVGTVGLWLTRLLPRGVNVERSSLWVGRVQRGEMVREVQARGVLVAKDVYWVTSTVAGRVERLGAVSGERVEAGAVIAELSNPELVLSSVEAERVVAAAESQAFALQEAALQTNLLEQSDVLVLRGSLRAAEASYAASAQLVKTGGVTWVEHERVAAERDSLSERLRAAEAATSERVKAARSKLGAARVERVRLRELAKFRQQRLAELEVRSAASGIIAEVRIERGQWVQPGTALAKVVNPAALKVRLFVPEAQAKDVSLGQSARVEIGQQPLDARVAWIAPAVENGSVAVELELLGALPSDARPDLAVLGRIQLERLADVVFVERPTGIGPDAQAQLFKLDGKGHALRQAVRFGRVSAQTVEVIAGLSPGDELILSDISKWDQVDKLQLNEEHQ